MKTLPKTALIGLGNTLLTDDGVGIAVVDAVAEIISPLPNLEIIREVQGGLRLMELLVGFERALICDAIVTGRPPGTILKFPLSQLPSLHSDSAHDLSLSDALKTGRMAGAQLPDDDAILIVAVEAEDVLSFGETLTPDVERAVPKAALLIAELLEKPRWDRHLEVLELMA